MHLRVVDAIIFPDVISGNTNAAWIMIGEKAFEIIARKHGISLESTVEKLS